MDLAVIEVSGAEAEAKLAEYEAVSPDLRTQLDEAILRAYRAVTGGARLIRLPAAVLAGGFGQDGMPRLGVAGAEWEQATCWWEGRSDLVFADHPMRQNRGAAVGQHSVRLRYPDGARPSGALRAGLAPVPPVPPGCRPRRGKLSRCHILWEVPAWDMTVPHDPYLIRHVVGDLWLVLSSWDLTELERAVLAQR
jgi:hypothetical protein